MVFGINSIFQDGGRNVGGKSKFFQGLKGAVIGTQVGAKCAGTCSTSYSF